MSSSGVPYLIVALVSLAVGLLSHGHAIVDGLGKAMFGVFFILFLIVRLFGEKEA